ncbi:MULTISPECIES: hypothetical protein [unclassified Streptomyces]|uniref:hypothetical protein n=1 Tax=unclassified Streptomyces TaxID=2593676 RepID=UPI0019262AEA|nr:MULTISPECIES: hypothetical protein [unclassified Streptomyces]
MLVAYLALFQPDGEPAPVGVRGQRSVAVGVHSRSRKQPSAAVGPAFQDVVDGHFALDLFEVFMPRRSPGEIRMQLRNAERAIGGHL